MHKNKDKKPGLLNPSKSRAIMTMLLGSVPYSMRGLTGTWPLISCLSSMSNGSCNDNREVPGPSEKNGGIK